MNIQEAAKRASAKGQGMYRESWPASCAHVIPTNTPNRCILNPTPKHECLGMRWQPGLDDLVADDWAVSGEVEDNTKDAADKAPSKYGIYLAMRAPFIVATVLKGELKGVEANIWHRGSDHEIRSALNMLILVTGTKTVACDPWGALRVLKLDLHADVIRLNAKEARALQSTLKKPLQGID